MRVVLGVGGGIAAYKSAELLRALQERGCTVQAVMTSAAQEFLRPLTLAALSGQRVITDLFESSSNDDVLASSIDHIRVAQENDVLVIAPATADLLSQLAHGAAPNFLTTLYLAFTGPVVVAPAMNVNMWQHAATQHNIGVLRGRGVIVVDPDSGALACGMNGPGRLAGLPVIVEAVMSAGRPPVHDLDGETVLITAGPTQEPLDPVRFISNRSSGKMGYALAEAALARGASVILVSGPVALQPPSRARVIQVKTAGEMREAVLGNLTASTIIVKAAAVADYHLAEVPTQKVKKTATRLTLQLDPTPDILYEIGHRRGDRLLIGFAAETTDLVQEARRKLDTKHCDMVVANMVGTGNTGFESDDNEVTLVMSTGQTRVLQRSPKREIADQIFDEALRLRLALHAVQ